MDKVLEILNSVRPDLDFEICNDFIDAGYLDSFDIINLVDKIEEEYNIVINALDIVPDNFNNTQSILALIKKSSGEK